MRNVIGISGEKYINDSLTRTNDGSNCVVLKVTSNTKLHPTLTIANEKIAITENDFDYEIPTDLLYGTGEISFNISDEKNAGETYTISRIEQMSPLMNGNLFLKKKGDISYELSMANVNDLLNDKTNVTTIKREYAGFSGGVKQTTGGYEMAEKEATNSGGTFELPKGIWMVIVEVRLRAVKPCSCILKLKHTYNSEYDVYMGYEDYYFKHDDDSTQHFFANSIITFAENQRRIAVELICYRSDSIPQYNGEGYALISCVRLGDEVNWLE